MKKINKLSVLALSGLLLVGCGGTPAASSDNSSEESNTSSDISSDNSSSSSDSSSTAPSNYHALVVSSGQGAEVIVENASADNLYEAGSLIKVSVSSTSPRYDIIDVKLDGSSLSRNESGTYVFTMPNHDVNLSVETLVLGEEGLDEPVEVTQDLVPVDIDGVITLLEAEKALEGQYFASGRYEVKPAEDYEETFSYNITAYQNDVLRVTGNRKSTFSNQATTSYVEERGISSNDRYYVYQYGDGSFSTTEDSGNATESLRLYTITDGEASTNSIVRSDAENAVKSYGFADILLTRYFDEESYSDGFASPYGWSNVRINSNLNEDRYSFVTTLTADSDSYSSMEYHTLRMTFDGLGFLTEAIYTGEEYSYDDYDNENHQPLPEAQPISTSSLSLEATRGYKHHYAEKISLNDYAMHDYEVELYYQPEGGERTLASDFEVENGSILSYNVTSHDQTPYLIKPLLVGAKEEGFLEVVNQGYQVVKEGEFTLLFDNGTGEIKEVSVTAVPALPRQLELSLSSSSVFVGESATLTASITPSSASQKVSVALADESAPATISENEDGTYNILTSEAGTVELLVTSSANPELQESISLTVVERPSLASIEELIYNHTMSYQGSSEYFYVNFNDDMTGSYRYGEEDYWSGMTTYQNVINFTYSIDPETLAISFELVDEVPYGDATLVTLSVIDNTSLSATIRHYDTPESPWTLTGITRIPDLSTLG